MSKICKNCGTEGEDAFLFCAKCGAKLDSGELCKRCGREVPKGAEICPHCGIRLDGKFHCPGCGRLLEEGAVFCPFCGRSSNPQAAPVRPAAPFQASPVQAAPVHQAPGVPPFSAPGAAAAAADAVAALRMKKERSFQIAKITVALIALFFLFVSCFIPMFEVSFYSSGSYYSNRSMMLSPFYILGGQFGDLANIATKIPKGQMFFEGAYLVGVVEAVAVAVTMIVTILCCVFAVVKSVRYFTTGEKCNPAKYVIGAVTAWIFLTAVLAGNGLVYVTTLINATKGTVGMDARVESFIGPGPVLALLFGSIGLIVHIILNIAENPKKFTANRKILSLSGGFVIFVVTAIVMGLANGGALITGSTGDPLTMPLVVQQFLSLSECPSEWLIYPSISYVLYLFIIGGSSWMMYAALLYMFSEDTKGIRFCWPAPLVALSALLIPILLALLNGTVGINGEDLGNTLGGSVIACCVFAFILLGVAILFWLLDRSALRSEQAGYGAPGVLPPPYGPHSPLQQPFGGPAPMQPYPPVPPRNPGVPPAPAGFGNLPPREQTVMPGVFAPQAPDQNAQGSGSVLGGPALVPGENSAPAWVPAPAAPASVPEQNPIDQTSLPGQETFPAGQAPDIAAQEPVSADSGSQTVVPGTPVPPILDDSEEKGDSADTPRKPE